MADDVRTMPDGTKRVLFDDYAAGATDVEKIVLAASQLVIGRHYGRPLDGSPLNPNQQNLVDLIYEGAQRLLPPDSSMLRPDRVEGNYMRRGFEEDDG